MTDPRMDPAGSPGTQGGAGAPGMMGRVSVERSGGFQVAGSMLLVFPSS